MNNSSIDLLNNVIVYLNRYTVSCFYIIGNIGNLLNASIFLQKSWRKNVCVFYLNICLLLNSGYINAGMLAAIFIFGFNINAQNSSVILCKLLYYTSYLFSTLSPTILILASIDRLLISSRDTDLRLYSSKRLAYFSVSTSTVFWLIFYSHTLVKITLQPLSSSTWVCYYDSSGFYYQFVLYSTLTINIILSTALIFLAVMTFKNVRLIRSIPRQQRQQVRVMNRKDFQLLRCLYVHDIVFIIFVTFPSVYAVYLAICNSRTQTQLQQAINVFITNIGTWMHHIPYCVSFFIYCAVSKAFRQELKRFFNCIIGKGQIGERNDINRPTHDIKIHIELPNDTIHALTT